MLVYTKTEYKEADTGDRQTDIKCRLPISYQLMEVGVLLPSAAMIPSNHEDWHTAVMDLDLALYVNPVLHD